METNLSFTLDDHFIRTKAGHAEQLYSGGQWDHAKKSMILAKNRTWGRSLVGANKWPWNDLQPEKRLPPCAGDIRESIQCPRWPCWRNLAAAKGTEPTKKHRILVVHNFNIKVEVEDNVECLKKR